MFLMAHPRPKPVRNLIGGDAPTPIEALRALAREAQLAAIRDAFAPADPAERPALALALLDLAAAPGSPPGGRAIRVLDALLHAPRRRHAAEALGAVVELWTLWPDDLREPALAVGENRWHEALPPAASSPDPLARAGAARLIADLADPALTAHALRLLQDDERGVARAAERALVGLGLVASGVPARALGEHLAASLPRRPVRWTREDRQRVIAALAVAASSFGSAHRARDALMAALLLADAHDRAGAPGKPELAILALLRDRKHAAAGPLRTALRRSTSPALRARAWRWLADDVLVQAAAERVARAHDERDHAALLGLAHLTLRPARRRALAAIPLPVVRQTGRTALSPEGPLPTPDAFARLPEPARAGVVRLAGAFAEPEETLRLVLEPALADPSPGVRHAAARAVPLRDLPDFCLDRDARVARSAALAWSSAGTPGSARAPRHDADRRRLRFAQRLARSEHAPVRAVAADERARLDPFDHASPISRLAARRWLAADERAFADEIDARLGSPEEPARVAAITLIRKLGVARRFEVALIDQSADGVMPRAAATAVRALGDVRTPGAIAAVRVAIGAADPRTRSNALEAVGRTPGAIGVLVECKDDPHHRARSSALRALIEGAPASDAPLGLAMMLTDDRPEHRLAGVWLAERTLTGAGRERLGEPWAELVHTLTSVAHDDPDPRVRARAARCARRVLIEMRDARVRQPTGALA